MGKRGETRLILPNYSDACTAAGKKTEKTQKEDAVAGDSRAPADSLAALTVVRSNNSAATQRHALRKGRGALISIIAPAVNCFQGTGGYPICQNGGVKKLGAGRNAPNSQRDAVSPSRERHFDHWQTPLYTCNVPCPLPSTVVVVFGLRKRRAAAPTSSRRHISVPRAASQRCPFFENFAAGGQTPTLHLQCAVSPWWSLLPCRGGAAARRQQPRDDVSPSRERHFDPGRWALDVQCAVLGAGSGAETALGALQRQRRDFWGRGRWTRRQLEARVHILDVDVPRAGVLSWIFCKEGLRPRGVYNFLGPRVHGQAVQGQWKRYDFYLLRVEFRASKWVSRLPPNAFFARDLGINAQIISRFFPVFFGKLSHGRMNLKPSDIDSPPHLPPNSTRCQKFITPSGHPWYLLADLDLADCFTNSDVQKSMELRPARVEAGEIKAPTI
ncbi:hypothetical protein DFH06DRAFT_1131381 [Mycena polygramma]|nr:hypothetical protein DFH06DRAFT_1131381 [Mycena polygramma]